MYQIIDGVRKQLGDKSDLKLKAGEWHTISITHVGKKIECKLNGEKLLEAENEAIVKAGKIGLWTKADAQTAFDGLTVIGLGK